MALERALPALSDDRLAVAADVWIVEDPVPDDAVDRNDADAALDAFGGYVEERAPTGAVATDSNLLIAHAPDLGASGAGQIPETNAERDATVAAVFDGLGQNAMDAATGYRSGSYGRALSSAVHEVGHNLGLGHDAGDARRGAGDRSPLYVTPMRTGHHDADEGVRTVYTPYFNPETRTGSLVVG